MVHPAQQVAPEVAHQHLVEVVRVEATSAQLGDGPQSHLRQRAAQRVERRAVPGDVEPDLLGRTQERGHRPVPAVGVMPEDAPVHQLDQRSHLLRALLARPQIAAFEPRQMEDRHPRERPRRARSGRAILSGRPPGGSIVPSTTQRSQIAGPMRAFGA